MWKLYADWDLPAKYCELQLPMTAFGSQDSCRNSTGSGWRKDCKRRSPLARWAGKKHLLLELWRSRHSGRGKLPVYFEIHDNTHKRTQHTDLNWFCLEKVSRVLQQSLHNNFPADFKSCRSNPNFSTIKIISFIINKLSTIFHFVVKYFFDNFSGEIFVDPWLKTQTIYHCDWGLLLTAPLLLLLVWRITKWYFHYEIKKHYWEYIHTPIYWIPVRVWTSLI